MTLPWYLMTLATMGVKRPLGLLPIIRILDLDRKVTWSNETRSGFVTRGGGLKKNVASEVTLPLNDRVPTMSATMTSGEHKWHDSDNRDHVPTTTNPLSEVRGATSVPFPVITPPG